MKNGGTSLLAKLTGGIGLIWLLIFIVVAVGLNAVIITSIEHYGGIFPLIYCLIVPAVAFFWLVFQVVLTFFITLFGGILGISSLAALRFWND